MGNKQPKYSDLEGKTGIDFVEKKTPVESMEENKRHVLEQLSGEDSFNTSISSGGVSFYMSLDDSAGSTPTRPLLRDPPKKKMAESKSDTYTLEERSIMAEVMNAESLREKVRKARTSEERRVKVMERREKQEQEKKQKYQEKLNMIEEKRKIAGKQRLKVKNEVDYKRC